MNIEVIIPTKDRCESIRIALESLTRQSRLPDIVTIVDGGSTDQTLKVVNSFVDKLNIRFLETAPGLIHQMNYALSKAEGDVVVRTDDDVIFGTTWIEGIYESMLDSNTLGVTGPTVVPLEFQKNRDLFRMVFSTSLFSFIQRSIYQFLCDGKMMAVGYWSSAGVFSIGSNLSNCIPPEEVQVTNLEACNFSVRLEHLKAIGGFDPSYIGIGEYHEPDACFKIQNLFPKKKMVFNPKASLNHCPSVKGFFTDRAILAPRIHNYLNFIKNYKNTNLPFFSNFKFVVYLFLVIVFFSLSIRSQKQFIDLVDAISLVFKYFREY